MLRTTAWSLAARNHGRLDALRAVLEAVRLGRPRQSSPLRASPMTGYKRNRRHWRGRALNSRKVSNQFHRDPGRPWREIIYRLAGLKASKERSVFRRTRSEEESLKVPFHLQMLGRCDIISAKGKPVPVVHHSLPFYHLPK